MIFAELLKMYKSKIVKLPEMILLGLKLESIDQENRVSLWYLLSAARIQYASFWKQKKIPKLENWITSLVNIIEMDKIIKKLRCLVSRTLIIVGTKSNYI